MQEELHDPRPVPVEVTLERVDVLVALLPEALVALARREPLRLEPLGVDLQRDDLLVVRAVEDADAPSFGEGLAVRQRKSWSSSSADGFPNENT